MILNLLNRRSGSPLSIISNEIRHLDDEVLILSTETIKWFFLSEWIIKPMNKFFSSEFWKKFFLYGLPYQVGQHPGMFGVYQTVWSWGYSWSFSNMQRRSRGGGSPVFSKVFHLSHSLSRAAEFHISLSVRGQV